MTQVETEADHEFILANCKGMKIMFNQSSLAENQIQKIRACIEYGQLKNGSGRFTELKIDHSYRDNICSPIQLSNPLKVMIECGNPVSGKITPALFQELGYDVCLIFCEIDGSFSNHHSNPTVDGDRVELITNYRKFVEADSMLMLLVQSVLPKHPGRTVLFDVESTSKLLGGFVKPCPGSPVMVPQQTLFH